MTFREGCFVIQLNVSTSVKLLRLSITINFTKDESRLGDNYDAPFCEQQDAHRSCYISLFKFKSFDPKLPQILDIFSVVAL